MNLRKLTILITSLIFAAFSHAAQSAKNSSEQLSSPQIMIAPDEDNEEDDESTQADCILWPGCIVSLEKKSN